MKKLPIRRLLAGLLCLVLALGLAACSSNAPAKKPADDTPLVENNPDVAGLLLVNFQAEVIVAYDKDGTVLYAEGINTDGVFITTVLPDIQGSTCAAIVEDIIEFVISKELTEDVNTVVVKQQLGSATPADGFMKTIQSAAEKAAADYTVFTFTTDDLDELGYISFEAADALLRTSLSLSADLEYPGTPEQISGYFTFTIPIGSEYVEYYVDAATGAVNTAESLGFDFEYEETIPEPDIPEDLFPEYPDEEILDMPETPD